MKPLVSVLMTTYNREKYIAEAIESVLASTYENFELIIVDDRSKDATVEIARLYGQKDKRVKIFVNDVNLGDYPNRNKAASYATGEFLKYVDADDFIYPWGLEQLVHMMLKFPTAGWGLCSLEQDIKRPFPFQLAPQEAYEYNYKGPGLFHKAPLSSIIKKTVFDEVEGFAPIRMAGDNEMWHKLAQKYPVVLMPHGMVWYREHNEQEMSAYHNFVIAYEGVKVSYLKSKDCPLNKTLANQLLSQSKYRIQRQFVGDLIKLKLSNIKQYVDCLRLYK